jgi:hypothetical protein
MYSILRRRLDSRKFIRWHCGACTEAWKSASNKRWASSEAGCVSGDPSL